VTRTPPRTVVVPQGEHAHFLAKAKEFAETARMALEDQRLNSAGLEAIHAVISACDAVTVARLGLRCKSEDHRDVLHLLSRLKEEGLSEVHRQVSQVLSVKSMVEYGGAGLSSEETTRVVVQAERVVKWVTDQVKD
jgi:HEPN domain-containing protein